MEKEKRIRKFDRQAGMYAKGRESSSFIKWRKELLGCAEGKVLELAVGAGANFPFYPKGVSVTAVDFSEGMLSKAKMAAAAHPINVEFICADIEKMSLENETFDTVVSTLSFCCYEDPVGMFEKIRRWCKPDGKILLLEHGISSNMAVSVLQRILNPLLYRMVGCHHNRNIVKLVQESGMKIDKAESHWFDMIQLIWAKP